MKLLDHLKHFLFGPDTSHPSMAEFMSAAARVGDAARKAGADDNGGPFGDMAKEMRNGVHKPSPSRKRSSGGSHSKRSK